MQTKIISLKPGENAKDALDKLFSLKISGLPVLDEKGRLLGMFTEKEIIFKILPSYVSKVGRFSYEENPKAVKQKILQLKNFTVKDLMRKEVVITTEDAALCEVAHLMVTQRARRIPVLNKAKEAVGIVAREDVLKALFEEYK
jgi:CBS domain-containing protein